MLFSVVIPAFNRRQFLERTLESVWRQAFADYELIVVDDGSTDDTAEYLQSLDSPLMNYRQVNQGPGVARNLGASKARGEYLAFLDSDDLWFPWTLGCFAKLIRQHNYPSILAGKFTEFTDETELSSVGASAVKTDFFDDYFSSHRAGYFVGAGTSVLRRDVFFKTGGYTDRRMNAEDHDLILRMGTLSGFVQITAPVTLGWRRHASSATANLKSSVDGEFYLVEQERRGAYPGGAAAERARREIITRHTRPVSLGCLRHGLRQEAWALYHATFAWNAALGRAKYLTGFPVLAAISKFHATQRPALRPVRSE